MTIRVVIADDEEVVRRTFRRILAVQDDIEVAATARDGAEALELARHLRPDVIVADIRMPGIDGLELTRLLAGPDVAEPMRIVVVTTFDLDEYVYAALRYGACGFLLKRSGPTLLVEAIRAAAAGDALISPQVTVRLLRQLAGHASRAPTPSVPLSRRETEVAGRVAQGKTNAEIAAELFVSPGTVKTHVANIQRKLNVRNRVGIAAWAWSGEPSDEERGRG